ncbi:unnamed protein product [Bursaphelenchus okinawaensis]|uniref:Transposase n=1 Tax=Bursaphelenchus okinawaensis TaxID=465554 RepID=A0A811LV30_9BILA|nr:unnamed protein product [Bursaphelenchus okinawaensis]CAG9128111.1 unnamed protein product [Bursaphelenchus okinawaensis]
MGYVKKLEKWVPHNLSNEQKKKRKEAAQKLLVRAKNPHFWDQIVTSDEKWVCYNNKRRSRRWTCRGQPASHFAKPDLRQKKLMLTGWWCSRGLIHYSYLKHGQTITANTYCEQIDEIPTDVEKTRPNHTARQRPASRGKDDTRKTEGAWV